MKVKYYVDNSNNRFMRLEMNIANRIRGYMHYEGRSEINASYFIMLAHDVRGEYC